MPIDKATLQAQVREVQAGRVYLEELYAQNADAKKLLEQTTEWIAAERIKGLVRKQATWLSQQEEALRSMALFLFQDSGESKPVAGVSIKKFKLATFDPEAALAWCRTNAPTLVKEVLDPNYRNVAETLGGPINITYEPRVTIATDLSKVVE